MPTKLKWIFIISAVLLGGMLMMLGEPDCSDSMKTIMAIENTCVVTKKGEDKHNRYQPTLFLSCIKSDRPPFGLAKYEFPTLYDFAQVGDTIVKRKGNMAFHLKGVDTDFIAYPLCHGKEIRK